MAKTETLSVRLSQQARRVLEETAHSHGAVGASALARDILEEWAAQQRSRRQRMSIRRTVSFLIEKAGDWEDEPARFFRNSRR